MLPSPASLFPELSPAQWAQLSRYAELLTEANRKVNLISRKDIENVWPHHILPSLVPVKTGRFTGTEHILDVGTGGGLPGIPLAVLFPDAHITLIDSTLRKVRMLWKFIEELSLKNVRALHQRIEEHTDSYTVVTGRAVTEFSRLVALTKKNVDASSAASAGWWYFSGGDAAPYLQRWPGRLTVYPLKKWLPLPYFEEKLLFHLRPSTA